jgi:hypothetical protein
MSREVGREGEGQRKGWGRLYLEGFVTKPPFLEGALLDSLHSSGDICIANSRARGNALKGYLTQPPKGRGGDIQIRSLNKGHICPVLTRSFSPHPLSSNLTITRVNPNPGSPESLYTNPRIYYSTYPYILHYVNLKLDGSTP